MSVQERLDHLRRQEVPGAEHPLRRPARCRRPSVSSRSKSAVSRFFQFHQWLSSACPFSVPCAGDRDVPLAVGVDRRRVVHQLDALPPGEHHRQVGVRVLAEQDRRARASRCRSTLLSRWIAPVKNVPGRDDHVAAAGPVAGGDRGRECRGAVGDAVPDRAEPGDREVPAAGTAGGAPRRRSGRRPRRPAARSGPYAPLRHSLWPSPRPPGRPAAGSRGCLRLRSRTAAAASGGRSHATSSCYLRSTGPGESWWCPPGRQHRLRVFAGAARAGACRCRLTSSAGSGAHPALVGVGPGAPLSLVCDAHISYMTYETLQRAAGRVNAPGESAAKRCGAGRPHRRPAPLGCPGYRPG